MNALDKKNAISFTKMHGAGNDFVVLNNLTGTLALTSTFIRNLADRHFGVGADQVLIIEKPDDPTNHFKYRIFNADGSEVQQCGNGARCFARFVLDKGLTKDRKIRVETLAGVIEPECLEGGRVKVNMGPVVFEPKRIPFIDDELPTQTRGDALQYRLPLDADFLSSSPILEKITAQGLWGAVASMGNPHLVLLLDEPASDELVARLGPLLESHPCFPERVNVGFMFVQNRHTICLRVYERGTGETLACGTGACAAATVAMSMGLVDARVSVHKRGGILVVEWDGKSQSPVWMEGPARTVYEGVFFDESECSPDR